MNTEKITINLGAVELGKIDYLVEQGLYSNRSDFIRTAVRANLAQHDDSIKEGIKPLFAENSDTARVSHFWNIGVRSLSRANLERLYSEKKVAHIIVIGALIVEKDVPAELFVSTVEYIKVYGTVSATNEIKAEIDAMQRQFNKNP